MGQTDNGKQNTYFSSLENMVAQGNPVPVLYGEMKIGSRVISQMMSIPRHMPELLRFTMIQSRAP
ncbi:tail assembly protein [Salmonella enterica subsp. enterica]|nr:tail assembly protein [Salmonella enterica subsp. enterica]ECV9929926.1 tail assembly protein [Salmonella enterica subsp. enterica]ECV9943084.1 tail assembly protein [Salmonella enterica subsp. enterica]ECV9947409.1 tail assembly protein [Salmonella enterica subsp. enterica]ECV9956235.1 tail assembly protein [Salmonella enterica subsp. enterica]